MNRKLSTAARLTVIVIILALMTLAVFKVGNKIRHPRASHGEHAVERAHPLELIKQQKKLEKHELSVANIPVPAGIKQRTLKGYYALRAYPGAPPVIPHPVSEEIQLNQDCNSCHKKGGFVPHLNAFTPITPHADYVNCLQCHGQMSSTGLFKNTEWVSKDPPNIKRSALPGSPPPVPHHYQMRENCAACHTGPAAPLEIRCQHPERVNCTQCHVIQNTEAVFSRPVLEGIDK